METGRAVLLHPAALRLPWHVAFGLAAAEMASHLLLTLAVVAGGVVLVALLLLLGVVSAPLGAAFVAWILLRSARDGARAAHRHARRAGAPVLRVIRGGVL